MTETRTRTAATDLAREAQRRRTFAIISHPDAGKTTLTEKLLLYSGMIRTAGMVGGRKTNKMAASDWMGMEQERGISITASAMQFTYKDVVINVLDTPGHQDFSEDTYRTLTAADSVIMVIDASKGVEEQTRKLFHACKLRGIPVFTFMNKMDLPARDPIDLMAEVEEVLGIAASPLNWPIGSGGSFAGVVDVRKNTAHFYTKTASGGSARPDEVVVPLSEAVASGQVSDSVMQLAVDEIELVLEAGNPFDPESFLAAEVTPVFFGSALSNFGVEPLFDAFIELAPGPSNRKATTDSGEIEIEPDSDQFSAFVFKLQANMDPRHRDCVAFMRVNSGRFEKDLQVVHQPSGKRVRLSRPHKMMVSQRENVEYAYPGDVIGIINPGILTIGDTISAKGGFEFEPLPRFQPELFAQVVTTDMGTRKSLDKGLEQLASEGAIQILRPWPSEGGKRIVAAVGQLQFDVLKYRLQQEYSVSIELRPLPYSCSAWLDGDPATFKKPLDAAFAQDYHDRMMLLFRKSWDKEYAAKNNPNHTLSDFG